MSCDKHSHEKSLWASDLCLQVDHMIRKTPVQTVCPRSGSTCPGTQTSMAAPHRPSPCRSAQTRKTMKMWLQVSINLYLSSPWFSSWTTQLALLVSLGASPQTMTPNHLQCMFFSCGAGIEDPAPDVEMTEVTYSVPGLDPDTQYFFRVRAENQNDGDSESGWEPTEGKTKGERA
jgi:hypothetical protein